MISKMPRARAWFSVGVIDDKIYLLGGCDELHCKEPYTKVDVYDPILDKWT
jgi:hypothetical protein